MSEPIHHDLHHGTAACWYELFNKIDHFLNNKLPVIRKQNILLKECLPELLKNYQLSMENKPQESPMGKEKSSNKINILLQNPNILDSEPQIIAIYNLMEAIHLFCDTMCKSDQISEIVSCKKLVQELLDTYPFKNNERDLIKFNPEKDFEFSISPIFIRGALLNLMWFYLCDLNEFSEKGTVPHHAEIYFSDAYNKNFTIHFRIYSETITNSKSYRFFENYFSVENGQVIPGVGFCHLSLLYAETNVSYTIKDEEYLDVSITIPKLDLPENNELCEELQGLIYTKDNLLFNRLKKIAKNLNVNLELISLPESMLNITNGRYDFVILNTWVHERGDGIEFINAWKKTGNRLPLFYGFSQGNDTHEFIENPEKFGLQKCFTLDELFQDALLKEPLIFKNIVLEVRKKQSDSRSTGFSISPQKIK